MNIHEYQAKALLGKFGVAVPQGHVAYSPEEAVDAARKLAGSVWVVKAQIHAGGRGKAGGVKVADGPDDAEAKAAQILGMDIKGHTVHKVLVEQASDIAEEYYASFLLDRANRTYLSMASREGGMEIEEVAATKPDALARIPVDALQGVSAEKAREIAVAALGGSLPALLELRFARGPHPGHRPRGAQPQP